MVMHNLLMVFLMIVLWWTMIIVFGSDCNIKGWMERVMDEIVEKDVGV
jgi:hypothetical protein